MVATNRQRRRESARDIPLPPAYGASADLGRRRPTMVAALTRSQRRFVEMRGRQILWRAANQLGKSFALAYKIVAITEAIGPYANRRPGPLRILVVSESKEQMEPLHRKLWELLPKDRIELETTEYIPGFGFRGKPPRITFIAGPGAGTVIVFATYAQGAKRIAGGTYDVVAADEPLPQKIYSECLMRCMHGDPGELWITLTMTPASPDVTYLRGKVAAKEVIELHTPLTVEAMRLEQSTACLWKGRRTPEAEVETNIAEFSRLMLAQERDMRINGGWEATVEDRILDNWGPHCVYDLRVWPGAYLAIGVDHGTGPKRQTAVLMQFDLTDLTFPRVGLLAEWRSPDMSPPEDDAKAILAMLERHGLNWRHVDAWWGDRATSTNRYGSKKDNKELHDHLALQVLRKGEPLASFPHINTPNKARYAVEYGYRLMNACMGRKTAGVPHFLVDASCTEFAKSAARHNGRQPKDPLKDMLDPVRYCLVEAVKPKNFVGLALLQP